MPLWHAAYLGTFGSILIALHFLLHGVCGTKLRSKALPESVPGFLLQSSVNAFRDKASIVVWVDFLCCIDLLHKGKRRLKGAIICLRARTAHMPGITVR